MSNEKVDQINRDHQLSFENINNNLTAPQKLISAAAGVPGLALGAFIAVNGLPDATPALSAVFGAAIAFATSAGPSIYIANTFLEDNCERAIKGYYDDCGEAYLDNPKFGQQ